MNETSADWLESVQRFLYVVADWFRQVWEMELFSSSGSPVRLSQIVVALAVLVAGIMIGFAAQRSIATLIAGVQIAFTQPFRVDDVVIVEGEWGRIEEIALTYVVVRIWDQRRLIVPISYFIEKPFQNWTRTSADILGTVELCVDYTLPVDAVREELRRILDSTPLWDGEVQNVQVTRAGERSITLRALVGARNAGDAWTLRCMVREKLIQFLATHYPHALPRARAELTGAPERTPPTP